ncbi:MAG: immunoglobulin domain-containing protein [Verrucomicrobia bacterium]|nr:immunoglobulin domain-containing protein [Verrucomicrobiota bacterium]
MNKLNNLFSGRKSVVVEWIRAAGLGLAICVSAFAAAPINDSVASRIALTEATNVFDGSNIDATREAGEPLHSGNAGGRSVWFSWTATTNGGLVRIEVSGSSFEKLLGVYRNPPVSSLTQVAADHDSGMTLTNRVAFLPVEGREYYIAVDGKNGASGKFRLSLVHEVPSGLQIVEHPVSMTTTEGGPATLSVVAVGERPVLYQWVKDGVVIAGATDSTLQISDAQASDAGSYQVIVRNAVASLTSSNAVLSLSIPYTFSLLAGRPGEPGVADGDPGTARFNAPTALAIDREGNLLVADTGNHLIRRIRSDGAVSTVAGRAGSSGSVDGPRTTAQFNRPAGLAVDSGGNVFVLDAGNSTIRKISPAGAVTTWAGQSGVLGSTDGLGTNARFANPSSLTAGPANELYVTDTGNQTIRKVSVNGAVTTFAGLPVAMGSQDGVGTGARFQGPAGIATDSLGNIYVTETENQLLRRLTPDSIVSTVAGFTRAAGSRDGMGAAARFTNARAVATDTSENVYVADTGNDTLRKVTPDGVVTTIAGEAGVVGITTNQFGVAARLNAPAGVAVDSSGVVFLADTGNHAILRGIPLAVTVPPEGQHVASGTPVTLSVKAAGAPPLAFQWLKDGVEVVGARDSALVLSDVRTNDSGTYSVKVSNEIGSVTSRAALLVVLDAPVIAAQPTSQTVEQGGSLALSVAVSGSLPLDYQWRRDGIAIPGETAPTLTVRNVQPSASGLYSLSVSNSVGVAFTSDIAVTVSFPPHILSQPASQTFVIGTNLTLRASVGGSAPLAYQWLRDGIALPGATNAELTVAVPQISDAGNYSLTIVNSLGAATTTNALIQVVPPVSLVTAAGEPLQQGSANGKIGTPALFSYPIGIAVDATGNKFIADSLNHTIRRIDADGLVTTLAGVPGAAGNDDGAGGAARFNGPQGVAVDAEGNILVADSGNHTIRRITPDGQVSTLAGSPGSPGASDGVGLVARFTYPYALTVGPSGDIFVADTGNSTIRRITANGFVTTFAGAAGITGSADGAGSDARFRSPSGLTVDSAGTLYVADTDNHLIRTISVDGAVVTIAGAAGELGSSNDTGLQARFAFPRGVALDSAGNLFIGDSENKVIRVMQTTGMVRLFAGRVGFSGSTDARLGSARFAYPGGLAIDLAGNLLVADAVNGTIRSVTGNSQVSTVAGVAGSSGSADGVAAIPRFSLPYGVAVDRVGNVYVADAGNHVIRKINTDNVVSTLAGLVGTSGSSDGSGSAARFNQPLSLALDASGNLIVVDTSNHILRRVTPGGQVTTLAGFPGRTGSTDGVGSAARFNQPSSVSVDPAGNIYVTDRGNHIVRRVTSAGAVSTIAGTTESPGSADGVGRTAKFSSPEGIVADRSTGNLFVSDTGNSTVRLITPNGTVSTFAGTPGAAGFQDGSAGTARFDGPVGLALDGSGNLYVADSSNHVIRLVTPSGFVQTLFGRPGLPDFTDGPGTSAQLNFPTGLSLDFAGNLHVADSGNHLIRKGLPFLVRVQATSVTALSRNSARIGVTLLGSGPFSLQWWKDGAPLPERTSPTIDFENVQLLDQGAYSAVVIGPGGTIETELVDLKVTPRLLLLPPQPLSGGGFRIFIQTEDGGLPADPGSITIQISDSISDGSEPIWLSQPVGSTTSNGSLVFDDPDGSSHPFRFYRLLQATSP